MDVDYMRSKLKEAYPYKDSPKWVAKVNAMHRNQVIALYYKFRKEDRWNPKSNFAVEHNEYVKEKKEMAEKKAKTPNIFTKPLDTHETYEQLSIFDL